MSSAVSVSAVKMCQRTAARAPYARGRSAPYSQMYTSHPFSTNGRTRLSRNAVVIARPITNTVHPPGSVTPALSNVSSGSPSVSYRMPTSAGLSVPSVPSAPKYAASALRSGRPLHSFGPISAPGARRLTPDPDHATHVCSATSSRTLGQYASWEAAAWEQ